MNFSTFRLLFFLFLPLPLFSQNGIIKGQVSDAFSNEPIMFANVLLLGTENGTTSDVDGKFLLQNLEPGLYNLRVSYLGYQDETEYEIQVSNNKPAEINIRLQESTQQLDEVVVRASPFKKTDESPVSLRTIGVAEIQRNPGANRDISKVVQSLPGVTTSASFRNDLIIRGGAPNENRFYLDEVEVPTINHFATQGASGGPVGMINVNFIREVDFYSGAFPANRGNSLSSVFDFRMREGREDRIGGTFMVGASDIGLTLEGPIGDKATFLVSARRSYLQFLFRLLELPFLPTYNDFQAKVKYKIDNKNELTFIGLGAIDDFALNFDANKTEEQQFLLDQLPVAPQWNYTTGLVYKHYTEKGYWTFVLSRNMLNNEAEKYEDNDDSDPDNLILYYNSREIENKFRVERNIRLDQYNFEFGAGYQFVKFSNSTFNKIYTASGPQTIDFSSAIKLHRYGLFANVSRKLAREKLTLSLGFRLDGNSYSEEMSNLLEQFSPRLSLAYAFSDRLSFNFNTGIYYQLPPYTILGYGEGGELVNKENGIRYIRADHLVAGLEFNTAGRSRITLEGYYKRYHDYPFLLRDSITLANLGGDFGVVGNEPAVPRSSGHSYGLEFLFQQRLFKGFYGIAAYTLGWSEFEDKNFNYLASSWDARHIVSVTAGKRFSRDWEVGISWRYQSALPNTPFDDDSSLRVNWDRNNAGIPNYDKLNTLRATAGSTIDIRVDKKWFFEKWSLNVYLDIENITGNSASNPQLILDRPLDENNMPIGDGIIVNPDSPYDQQRYLLKELDASTGSPIPSIGIMVEI